MRSVWFAATALALAACAPAPAPIAPLDLSACAEMRDGAGELLMGGEDAAWTPAGLLVSFDDRRGEGRGSLRLLRDGALASDDLTQGAPAQFHPHGVGVYVDAAGIVTVMAVNHAERWDGPHSSVEIYTQAADGMLTHRETVVLPGFARLNDVAPVAAGAFYAANESAAKRNTWRAISDFVFKGGDGALVFYADGETRVIAGDLAFANSVETAGGLVAVSDTIRGEVRLYEGEVGSGDVRQARVVDVGVGADNLIANDEAFLIVRHDNLRHFVDYARGARGSSPWSVVTLDFTGGVRVIGGSNGIDVAAMAVAAPLADGGLFLGSVFDEALVCPAQARG